MGNSVTEQTGGNSGSLDIRTGSGSDYHSSGSTNTGARTGAAAGTGTTAGAGAEEKESSAVVVLNQTEEEKRIERNKKRRERYAAKKEAAGEAVEKPKPKKVNKKKTKQSETISKESLDMMIAGLFSVIGSKPGCEHWNLSDKEIDSITTPLCKMLEESTAFANMGAYSNQIALVMACFTVFMPRLVVTAAKQKEKKKIEITGQSTDTNVRPSKGTVTPVKDPKNKSDDRNNGAGASNGLTNHVHHVPYYGVPIA